jgi:hypothetical protein
VIAVVVIGVGAYFLSQPKKGTVEWHEREYWALRKGQSEPVAGMQLILGRESGLMPSQEHMARTRVHEAELVKHGRLTERIVVVSNAPPTKVVAAVRRLVPGARSDDDFVDVDLRATNTIRLVTRTNNAGARLANWERLIREADVPETK